MKNGRNILAARVACRAASSDSSVGIRHSAFTLIEMLVVMAIIVLLIALALPAFNFITGSRSTEAANNQLSAVFGIARAEAIGLQQPRGVAIWHDRDTDRTIAALVDLRYGPFAAYDETASAGGTSGATANRVSYAVGEYRTVTGSGGGLYVCTESFVDTNPTANKPNTGTNAGRYWRKLKSFNTESEGDPKYDGSPIVDFKPNTEFISLPKGIDARGVGNAVTVPNALTALASNTYRYSSVVVVMFDAYGTVKTLPYGETNSAVKVSAGYRVLPEGLLGMRANLGGLIDGQATNTTRVQELSPLVYGKAEITGQPNPYRANTAIGLVVYETDVFRAATTTFDLNGTEDWLDQNAAPVLIGRNTGTVTNGE